MRSGIYAFDYDSGRSGLFNRRLIHVVDTHIADGIKVSERGYILTAAGSAVDVIRPSDGVLVGKIAIPAPDRLNNLVAVPGAEWWLVGRNSIWRARIAEQGIVSYG